MATQETDRSAVGFAPYNFIPFHTGKVPMPYTRDQKGNDSLPAFNDQREGELSGYVDYEIRVMTDLAIGGRLVPGKGTDGETVDIRQFYRDVQGNPAIPGSEMRGLVRSAAEILSLARPEAVSDERYMYRSVIGNCTKVWKEYQDVLAAPRISKGEKGRNQKQADKYKGSRAGNYAAGKSEEVDRQTLTPVGVKAGILTQTSPGCYEIQPLRNIPNTNNTFLKISEKTLRKEQESIHLDESHFLYTTEDCRIANENYRPYRGIDIEFRYHNGLRFDVEPGTGTKGTLLNSAYVERKTHHYLVSNVPAAVCPIKIDPADARAYQHDYERNCIQNKALVENAEFYALPQVGESKVFFYKQDDQGALLGFGPTPYFRIFYRHSLQHGLPMIYDASKGIDYVTAMFGYLGDDSKAGYKSRLSFADATLCRYDSAGNAVMPVYEQRDLSVRHLPLMSPRGSAFDLYLEQEGRSLKGENNQGLLTYNDERFRLRGSKVYWKRSGTVEPKASGDNDAILSHIEVLRAERSQDKRFLGRVYFDNLHEDELGLLLLSLQYQDATDADNGTGATDDNERNVSGGSETRLLGSARPYGYGKVGITIRDVRLLSDKERFLKVTPVAASPEENPAHYKAAFKEAVVRALQRGGEAAGDDSSKTPVDQSLYEQLPTIRVYRAWLMNDNVDEALQHGGYVYMPVENTPGVPGYGNCEPMPLAAEILGMDEMPRPERIVNAAAQRGGQQRASAHVGSYTVGDDTDDKRRAKKPGCVRMVVLSYTKGQDVFKVKPANDEDARRKFPRMTEVSCYYACYDPDYTPDPKRLQPGVVIIARAETRERKNRKTKRMEQVLVAVDWYTEEE